MASIQKTAAGWRVQLSKNGQRESRTFSSKLAAVAWSRDREAELTGERLPDKTLDDALARYAEEKAPALKGSRWALVKIRNLRGYKLAKRRLATITGPDIAEWRDARLSGPRLRGKGTVSGPTVAREMGLLRSVLEAARLDWGWLRVNPMADVKRPPKPTGRKRRITDAEISAICKGLGYVAGPPVTVSQRVALAFLFAIETAMRGGEIVRLQWADVGKLSVRLPKTKNGDQRHVPLSSRAREILALFPAGKGPVFGLTDSQKDALFRAGRARTAVDNLHFHDSRSEAIWRLSKKLDVLELARVIGHRDLKSLLIYYDASADELAAKLG